MFDIKTLMQSMTNRLVLVTVLAYFVVEALFAGQRSGLELYFWQSPDFKVWQLVTSIFLHGGLAHLAFNMIGLWSFGRVLEKVWGNQRFLVFYLLCGIGAGIISIAVSHFQFQSAMAELLNAGFSESDLQVWLANGSIPGSAVVNANKEALQNYYYLFNAPMVGASGAIYGILTAFALLFPNFKIMLIFLPVPVAAKYFVPVLLMIDLTSGITGVSIFGQNIAHFAHIGGAIVGAALVLLWQRRS